MAKSPLMRKFGLTGFRPITPPDIRASIKALILGGIELDEVARLIRRRYKAGEWDDEIAAGQFEHLEQFKFEDWQTLTRGVKVGITASEIAMAQGEEPIRRGKKITVQHAALIRERQRDAGVAEAEEFGDDAKKRLERLRKALMSRLTIDEQADLLVAQARSDHGATSRSATAHIIEILGMKAANVVDAPTSAPIFALPEGVGPGIR